MTSEERRRRDKYLARKRRRKRRRTIQIAKRAAIVGFGIFLIVFGVTRIFQKDSAPDEVQAKKEAPKTVQKEKEEQKGFQQKVIAQTPEFKVDLLTPNPYSRPQTAIEAVKGIVVHYTANPGTTAAQNRSYFESLKDTQKTKASSHFVVGLEGEVIQCIPSTEMSYASNDRNVDTLSIECCHMDETGQFTQETYDSLVLNFGTPISAYPLYLIILYLAIGLFISRKRTAPERNCLYTPSWGSLFLFFWFRSICIQIFLHIFLETCPGIFIFHVVNWAFLSSHIVMPDDVLHRKVKFPAEPCGQLHQGIIGFLGKLPRLIHVAALNGKGDQVQWISRNGSSKIQQNRRAI